MIKFINVNYNIFLMWDIENRMDDKDCCEILILVNKKKIWWSSLIWVVFKNLYLGNNYKK